LPRQRLYATNAARQAAWRQRKARTLADFPSLTIGTCTLYQGDARHIVPLLPTPWDALVTDPPYGVSFSGKGAHQSGTHQVKRHDTYLTYDDTPENFAAVILPTLKAVLARSRAGGIFCGSQQLTTLNLLGQVGGTFLANGCGVGKWGFECFMHVVLCGSDPYLAAGLGSRPTGKAGLRGNGNDANTVAHPCAKPLEAMAWAVDRVSLPGQTIIDPFMGSGTCGVACVHGGRPFVGIELDPTYFRLACERIDEATRQGQLFRPPRPPAWQVALFAL
jgi:site-specific DNA-methyltransferase (adenine-specific)